MKLLDEVHLVYKDCFIYLFLGLFAFVILFPISPAFGEIPGRDSGVFLYEGQNILNGGLPYLSVWDHKGPLIYYIDAIGLALNHNSWWGTWIIEFLFIYSSLIIGFILLNRLFGFLPAIIGSISWLTILCFFIEGGNLTEEYGILFQFIIFYLFYRCEQEQSNYKMGYLLIGVTTSLIFLLKPNLIGVSLTILLYLVAITVFYNNAGQTLRKIKYFAAGIIAVIVPISLIFLIRGNFFDFIDQFFFYNIIYSSTSIFSKFLAFKHFLSAIAAFNLVFVILLSWIFVIIFVVRTHDNSINKKILTIAIINLPIEFIFASYPAEPYLHYCMTLLPIISIFIGFFVYCIISNFSPLTKSEHRESSTFFGKILAIVIIFGLCISPYVYLLIFTQFSDCYNIVTTNGSTKYAQYDSISLRFNQPNITDRYGGFEISSLTSSKTAFIQNNATDSTIRFILKNTTKDDYVLMFGAETAINFITQRRSPTRFEYQYPLYMQGYDNPLKDQEFLSDLAKNPPKLIIITNNPTTPFEKFKQIITNYKLVAIYGDWKIYQKIT